MENVLVVQIKGVLSFVHNNDKMLLEDKQILKCGGIWLGYILLCFEYDNCVNFMNNCVNLCLDRIFMLILCF